MTEQHERYGVFLRRCYNASGLKPVPTWTTIAGKAVVQVLGLDYNHPEKWTDAAVQMVAHKIKANRGK